MFVSTQILLHPRYGVFEPSLLDKAGEIHSKLCIDKRILDQGQDFSRGGSLPLPDVQLRNQQRGEAEIKSSIV